jgi:hypothetical protein
MSGRRVSAGNTGKRWRLGIRCGNNSTSIRMTWYMVVLQIQGQFFTLISALLNLCSLPLHDAICSDHNWYDLAMIVRGYLSWNAVCKPITRGTYKTNSTVRTLGFSRSRSPTVQELNMSCLVYTRRFLNERTTTRCQVCPRDADAMHVESKRKRSISIQLQSTDVY